MTPEQAGSEPEPAEPSSADELPPPPPPDEEPTYEGKSSEDIWKEDYDDLVEPEKERPKEKKSRHWGAMIITVAIIVILLGWTLASPDVLNPVGDRYTQAESSYARWGNYTGDVKSWAGNTTWGVSLSGHSLAADNRSVQIDVLVTKAREMPSNWFLVGTAMELRNVSVYTSNGTWLASMSNQTDLGFGVLASVSVSFASAGEYDLYVTVKFLVYEDMRIGFLPLRMVNVQAVYLEPTINVT